MRRKLKAGLFCLLIGWVAGSLWIGYSAVLHEGHWKVPDWAKAVKNPIPADAKSLAEGKELYNKYCTMCHGETGKGDGPMAAMLKEAPADLSELLGKQTDGEVFYRVSEGRDPMPSFGKKLAKEEIWKTVIFVKSLVPPDKANE